MAPEDDGATSEEITQTNRLSCRKTCQPLWSCRWHGLPGPGGPSNQNGLSSPGAEAANRGVAGGLCAGPVAWSWKWSRRISMKKFWLSLGLGLILTCWCGGGYWVWNRYSLRTVLRSSRAALRFSPLVLRPQGPFLLQGLSCRTLCGPFFPISLLYRSTGKSRPAL